MQTLPKPNSVEMANTKVGLPLDLLRVKLIMSDGQVKNRY